MREWLGALPWWSALAAHGVILAGCAGWSWARVRRLGLLPQDAIDVPQELASVGAATSVAILAVMGSHMLLPNPWPGTIYGIAEWLAASGVSAALFIPVRKRATNVETPDLEIAWGMLVATSVQSIFILSFLVPMLVLAVSGATNISNNGSLEWEIFRLFGVSCACYGGTLGSWAFFAPWLVSRTEGLIEDGVLFDMTQAAFRRAGLPAPVVMLTDGRLDGDHLVGYCGAPFGLSKAVIVVDRDILSVVTVRELAAVLRHEAAHAARNHMAADLLWRWLCAAIPCACMWLVVVALVRFDADEGVAVLVAAGAVSTIAIYLYSMRLSRAREMDADADAVLLYGAEPQAMLDVVAVLDRLNGGIAKPRFWESRTHPHIDERSAELRRRVALSGG